ncbi:uracil-DNA glycosylase family protein [Microbulbifer variabilis]|uniref:uracil-DNA glycosylase family protein n=1 Tax=Microbulbifer variabilis TaxID=266805 RepID=UPI001CFEA7B6|nr:uracil-DNA glycosylase family protein [Microbulbifer variabilis]
MNELQRAEYLSVLGIASYVPRFVLPLAPEPRQAKLPPAEPEAIEQPLPLVTNPLPQSAAQIVDSPVTKERDTVAAEISALTNATKVQAPEKPAIATPVTAPSQQVKPFVLNCWRLGETLLAVDSHEPGAALPLDALFGNIVRALNWHQLPRQQERMHWPMVENRFGPAADASEARDTFSSWLEASCSRYPVQSIWLMGREAQEFCTPQPLESDINHWGEVRILPMPSLSQLLQQPLRKRELWQLLRKAYPAETRTQ